MKDSNPEYETQEGKKSSKSSEGSEYDVEYDEEEYEYKQVYEVNTQTRISINPNFDGIEEGVLKKNTAEAITQTETSLETEHKETQTKEEAIKPKLLRDEKFGEEYEKDKANELKENIKGHVSQNMIYKEDTTEDLSYINTLKKETNMMNEGSSRSIGERLDEEIEKIEKEAENMGQTWADWLYKWFYGLYVILFGGALPFFFILRKMNKALEKGDEFAREREYIYPNKKLFALPESKILFTPIFPETYIMLILTSLSILGFDTLQNYLNKNIKNQNIVYMRRFIYSLLKNIFRRL